MNFSDASRNSSSTVSHALLRQSAGVLDLLRAVGVRPAVEHAARPKLLLERRVLGIVGVLRLLLGVQVIQVALRTDRSESALWDVDHTRGSSDITLRRSLQPLLDVSHWT
jgi:hypothetical protein